jgi:arabinofuranosyltransferase
MVTDKALIGERRGLALTATPLVSSDERGAHLGERRLNWATWLAVALPAVMVAWGGWAHRWATDDAYIDFRVVGNLVGGHGPVYNIGERVEVYTDPLWVGMLTVCRELLGPTLLPWCAVVVGLACTVAGVVLGARAAQRVGAWHGGGVVVPIGLIAVCALDAMWDFATSGLETGMIFAWEGLSWWLLVRAFERGRGAVVAAFVMGLGVLIRPDMALVSIAFLVALAVVIRSSEWQGPRSWWRGWAVPALAAVALPVAYELFRMAYFGLLVPNTALAKDAGGADWSQGWLYLTDLTNPAWLWIPLAAVAAGLVLHWSPLRRAGGRAGLAVLVAPVAGGILSWLYVIRVGGDFMHARMLLPGLFLFGLTLYGRLRGRVELAIIAICALWAVSVAAFYRYPPAATGRVAVTTDNERALWIFATKNPHPVTRVESAHDVLASDGVLARAYVKDAPPSGSGRFLILSKAFFGVKSVGKGSIPERVVVTGSSIGEPGVFAGPQVYIFDQDSLANPVSSHFPGRQNVWPACLTQGSTCRGDEKPASLVWMYGRFLPPGEALPPGVNSRMVVDARAAVSCGPLADYLRSITKPLSAGGLVHNLTHALSFTTMSYSPDPTVARQQLCH